MMQIYVSHFFHSLDHSHNYHTTLGTESSISIKCTYHNYIIILCIISLIFCFCTLLRSKNLKYSLYNFFLTSTKFSNTQMEMFRLGVHFCVCVCNLRFHLSLIIMRTLTPRSLINSQSSGCNPIFCFLFFSFTYLLPHPSFSILFPPYRFNEVLFHEEYIYFHARWTSAQKWHKEIEEELKNFENESKQTLTQTQKKRSKL